MSSLSVCEDMIGSATDGRAAVSSSVFEEHVPINGFRSALEINGASQVLRRLHLEFDFVAPPGIATLSAEMILTLFDLVSTERKALRMPRKRIKHRMPSLITLVRIDLRPLQRQPLRKRRLNVLKS